MNKRNGLLAEVLTSAKLIENGFSVSQPLDPASRYDLVVDNGRSLIKVQVKSLSCSRKGYHLKSAFRLRLYTFKSRGAGKNIKNKYEAKDVDMFVVYIKPLDIWYVIPQDNVEGKNEITLLPNSSESMYDVFEDAWHLFNDFS